MVSRDFFIDQLRSTTDALEWSFFLDESKNTEIPPFDSFSKRLFPENEPFGRYYGTWSRTKLLFHLVHYEEHIALPSMKVWIGGEPPKEEDIPKEEDFWTDESHHTNLIQKLKKFRKEQVEVIKQLNDEQWDETKSTIWGERSIEWIVSKTIQHSFEHGNKMMRHGLFWEGTAEMMHKFALQKKEKSQEIDEDALRELQQYIAK